MFDMLNKAIPDDHACRSDKLDLADIQVETTVSSSDNHISVVISNQGNHTARITRVEPALSMTARGVFNFSRLLTQGRLTLAPGESAKVDLIPRGLLPEAASPAFLSASILASELRHSFRIMTEDPAIGRVQVLEGVRMV